MWPISLQAAGRESYNFVLEPSASDLVVLFGVSAAVVAGVFLFLARDVIFRKKTDYDDDANLSSKDNRDYEKYHSDWHDEYYDDRHLDIPDDLPDYYDILGVGRDATPEQIKERYRHLAKETHPDRARSESSEEKMAQINEAYEVLSDVERRKKYDASRI